MLRRFQGFGEILVDDVHAPADGPPVLAGAAELGRLRGLVAVGGDDAVGGGLMVGWSGSAWDIADDGGIVAQVWFDSYAGLSGCRS